MVVIHRMICPLMRYQQEAWLQEELEELEGL
jgi:putative SOS response-associated peptidase YedK